MISLHGIRLAFDVNDFLIRQACIRNLGVGFGKIRVARFVRSARVATGIEPAVNLHAAAFPGLALWAAPQRLHERRRLRPGSANDNGSAVRPVRKRKRRSIHRRRTAAPRGVWATGGGAFPVIGVGAEQTLKESGTRAVWGRGGCRLWRAERQIEFESLPFG